MDHAAEAEEIFSYGVSIEFSPRHGHSA